MSKESNYILADLRHVTLFPRRYKAALGLGVEYWDGVVRRYKNYEKVILSSDWHWRVIEFDDGRCELAYLRVLQNGFFSGHQAAIYRGLVIPRRIGYGTWSHVKSIRLAF